MTQRFAQEKTGGTRSCRPAASSITPALPFPALLQTPCVQAFNPLCAGPEGSWAPSSAFPGHRADPGFQVPPETGRGNQAGLILRGEYMGT